MLHSGAVMGFALVSLASLGMLLIYLALKYVMPEQLPNHILMEVIAGFGLGGSAIALRRKFSEEYARDPDGRAGVRER